MCGGVTSTYFVLVTSDFYNVFSRKSYDGLKRLISNGHTIGLHFDEVCYDLIKTENIEVVKEKILEEADLLGRAIGRKIEIVSMHRPSKLVLTADICIPGMINSYGATFFKEFKYLSDSRRRWREPVDELIVSGKYERLHILTHAIWYKEKEMDIHETVSGFINEGNHTRYQYMKSNITDLESIMPENKIVYGGEE